MEAETSQVAQPVQNPSAPIAPQINNTSPQEPKGSLILPIIITALVCAVLFGGTGYFLGNQNTPQPKLTPTTTQPSIPVEATGESVVSTVAPGIRVTGTQPAAPTPELGELMQTTSGQVTLTLDKSSYKKGAEKIKVTVANGLNQNIYAYDQATHCSIVSLEYKNGERWEPVSDCLMGRVPLVITTGAGRGRTIELYTIPTPPLPPNDPYAMKPGTYRVIFAYGTSVEEPVNMGDIKNIKTLYSNTFTLTQ